MPHLKKIGVGAELCSEDKEYESCIASDNLNDLPITDLMSQMENFETASLDTISTIDRDDEDFIIGNGMTTNSRNEPDDSAENLENHELNLEELRQKVKVLAVRPVEGGDGQMEKDCWESELNETVNKLDRLMMLQESTARVTEKPPKPPNHHLANGN